MLWCLYILMPGRAFFEYIFVWGQLYFWGITVITILVNWALMISHILVDWLWKGFIVNNIALRRFFTFLFFFGIFVFLLFYAILHFIADKFGDVAAMSNVWITLFVITFTNTPEIGNPSLNLFLKSFVDYLLLIL